MEALIHRFYKGFQTLDAESMLACYHRDVRFQDPAFGALDSKEVRAMWTMLAESQKGRDFRLSYEVVSADEEKGQALWEAQYTFSKTGRRVHNRIVTSFRFREGLIVEHKDRFNLHRWASQALGPMGYLIGWTPFFRKKLQAQTRAMLLKYMDA